MHVLPVLSAILDGRHRVGVGDLRERALCGGMTGMRRNWPAIGKLFGVRNLLAAIAQGFRLLKQLLGVDLGGRLECVAEAAHVLELAGIDILADEIDRRILVPGRAECADRRGASRIRP